MRGAAFAAGESVLRAEEASLALGARRVVDGVRLAIRSGCLTAIAGPNGAGKSSLLRLLTGEARASEGRVTLDGADIGGIAPRDLARRRAVLPQSSSLAFPFTVAEVVGFGLEAAGRRVTRAGVEAALARVDLEGFETRRYPDLSGGEQQRVHLARVLAQLGDPLGAGEAAREGDAGRGARFLFLDEPTASLDIRHQLGVLEQARRVARAGGGVVAVLHDLNLAAAFADRLVVMANTSPMASEPSQD